MFNTVTTYTKIHAVFMLQDVVNPVNQKYLPVGISIIFNLDLLIQQIKNLE